jgi:hypothetical protein
MDEERRGWYATVNDLQKQFNASMRESWIGRAAGWISENIMPAMYAWTRQGAKEAAQALKALPDSIHPVEELGGLGNPTQMEVNHEKGEYQQWLDAKRQQVAGRQENDMGREL